LEAEVKPESPNHVLLDAFRHETREGMFIVETPKEVVTSLYDYNLDLFKLGGVS